jgi:hypothetical protein
MDLSPNEQIAALLVKPCMRLLRCIDVFQNLVFKRFSGEVAGYFGLLGFCRGLESRKSISNCAFVETGSPYFVAGMNRHCRNASIAFSSSPFQSPRTNWMSYASPLTPTTAERTTTPSNLASKASLVYSASTLRITRREVVCVIS